MVNVQLLGPVAVRSDAGDEVPLGGSKQRAVLAALALAWPRSQTSDQLIDVLWDQQPPASARNAIQVYVTGLRKILRPHDVELVRAGAGYALQGQGLHIDVSDFVALVAEGRAALRTGDHARAVESLTTALTLWVGVPLDGLDEGLELRQSREGLELERVSALVDLAEGLIRSSRPDEAVTVARRLLAGHPLDERGWMALATGHYRAGRQAEALEACRRVRELLADELGADPSPALAALELQILRHELFEVQPVPEVSQRSLPPLPEPFVGRGDVVDAVSALLLGGEQLVSLVGMGGIGKTTVAVAVAHQLQAADHRVGFSELEALTDASAAAARLCEVVGVDPGDDAERALAAGAAGWLLVLDNVEQIEGLNPVLTRLLRSCVGMQVLLTSRRPLRVAEEHIVQVPPLPDAPEGAAPAEMLFLVRAAAVRPGLDQVAVAPSVRELCGLLGGIPLAIELAAARVRTLTPPQLLARLSDGRNSVLEASRHLSTPLRQASLGAVLHATVEMLSPPAGQLLECLGSFGGCVSLELLESASDGCIDGEFVDAVDELTDLGLLRLDPDGRAGLLGPVKEYASSMGDRATMDRRMLDAAVSLVHELAPALVGRGADAALGRLRRDANTLNVALHLATAIGSVVDVAALAIGLHRYWLLNGQIAQGRDELNAALTRATGLEVEDRVRLHILAGTFASYLNDPQTETQLLPALHTADQVGLPADRILVNGWCCLAAYQAHHGNLEAADMNSGKARAAAAASGDPRLVALARDLDGHLATYAGDFERGLAAKIGGIADARHSSDEYDLISLLVGAADDLVMLGRADEALTYANEAFDRAGSSDVGNLVGYVVLMRGLALAACGQSPAAWGSLREALRLTLDQHADPLAIADSIYLLGACAADLGRDTQAARLFGAADATYTDQDVTAASRYSGILTEHRSRLTQRLGQSQFDVHAALGASDPTRTAMQVLDHGA